MILLQLFYEFFKTGLFAIGGGLATLPFLYDIAARYPWFTQEQLLDMIAVSESTPGPIGVNMATYAGFSTAGVVGAVVATVGLIAPSVIIILVIARFLEQFKDNRYVQDALGGLRPASTGLIAAAGFQVLLASIFTLDLFRVSRAAADLFDLKALALFAALLAATNIKKWKLHPIVFLLAAAVVGVIFEI